MPMIFPLMAFAAGGYGFTGLLQLTYRKDTFKDPDAESGMSTFTQEYRLQYRDYVYNPKLFTYTVGGAFQKDDTNTEGPRFSGQTINTKKIKNPLFNIKFEVLQGSKYPFTMYIDKFEAPSQTIQPDLAISSNQEIDRYGIFGNVFHKSGTNFRYDWHQDSIKTTGFVNEDRTYRNYLIGADRRRVNEIIDLSYTYQDNDGSVTNDGRITKEIEKIHDGKVFVWLKPSSVTDIIVDSNYNDNSFTQLNNISSVVKLSYVPSGNFNSNISLYGNRIKQVERAGQFETFFTNSTYRINEHFTTDQNLVLYRSAGDFGNESSEALTLGLNFARPLPNGYAVSANTSVNGTLEKSDINSNRNTMYYVVAGQVSKLFSKVNTTLTVGGSYYNFGTSRNGKQTRYDINGGFNSSFIKNLTLQSTLTYYTEDISDDVLQNIVTRQTKKTQITSDSSLLYFLQVTIRSSLEGRLGALVTTVNNELPEKTSDKRTFLYTDWIFKYAVRKNLLLNAGVRYYKESVNSTTTLSGYGGAEFRLKAILIKYVSEFWRESGPFGDRTRMSNFLQFSRPF